MRSVLAACVTCVALLVTGCSFTVGAVEPKPNIALPTKSPVFELEMQPTVKDTYEVPSSGGIQGGTVEAWRSSLEKGFAAGFPSGVAENGTAKLRLELAEFSFVPAAVNSRGGTVGARGQLKFRGRWIIGDKEIPVSGTAESKAAATGWGDIDPSAASAIETMYEGFAQALFETMSKQPAKGEQTTPDKTETDAKSGTE